MVEDLQLDTRATMSVKRDFQFRRYGGIGGLLLRKDGADGKAKTKDTY